MKKKAKGLRRLRTAISSAFLRRKVEKDDDKKKEVSSSLEDDLLSARPERRQRRSHSKGGMARYQLQIKQTRQRVCADFPPSPWAAYHPHLLRCEMKKRGTNDFFGNKLTDKTIIFLPCAANRYFVSLSVIGCKSKTEGKVVNARTYCVPTP